MESEFCVTEKVLVAVKVKVADEKTVLSKVNVKSQFLTLMVFVGIHTRHNSSSSIDGVLEAVNGDSVGCWGDHSWSDGMFLSSIHNIAPNTNGTRACP